MKRLVLFFLLFYGISLFAGPKYAIKSGYIEYQLSGSTNGVKKIWWDDYGSKSRTEERSVTETKIFGMVSREEKNQVDIINGYDIYSYNPESLSGTRSQNPFGDLGESLTENLTEAEQKELADQILNSLGGSISGSEKILGKNCAIMELMGSKSWIYKGILLKSDTRVMMIQNTQTAVVFKENEKPAASLFIPEANIEFQDLTVMQEAYESEYADDDSDDNADNDEPIIPVNYSFDKFQSVITGFSAEDYRQLMVVDEEGQYIATYMKGFGNLISIVLSSAQMHPEFPGLETFRDGGKTCHYGIVNDDGNEVSVLIVEYPAQDMALLISSKTMGQQQQSKEQMLTYARQLKF
ncbi:MAG TPA: hypothetical protein ENN84_09110 [Candidatus Marinimicrobia bacterium]|nr:hypothetical protein [Candidatus Neomarinimicrobiota bacterium]